MSDRRWRDILGALEDFLTSHKFSSLEEGRFSRDLNRVWSRLKHGEYKDCDFTGNTFNIPDRLAEFYTYLTGYLSNGKTWEKIFLDLFSDIKPLKIINLCAGWSPKVEMGLWYCGYNGSITVVDSSHEALERHKTFIEIFNPKFTFDYICDDLWKVTEKSFDICIGNHIIDDLLLNLAASEKICDSSEYYSNEERMNECWKAIFEVRNELKSQLVQKLSNHLPSLVKDGGLILLTHYKSNIERIMEIDWLDKYCRDCIFMVCSNLEDVGFKRVPSPKLSDDNYFHSDDCFILKSL